MLVQRPCLPASAGAAGTDRPRHENTNVILISIDTLQRDHLGCYGYQRQTSPNIDRLASEGVIFENFIGQAILTPISQMSIFTSQYPRVNGMTSFAVRPDEVTRRRLPQILKLYGYTNAAFLSSREFTRQYKALSGETIQTGNIFSDSFDVFDEAVRFQEIPQAVEWLRENRDSKFFMWIAASTVHWPYSRMVPEPYKTIFDGLPPGPEFSRELELKTSRDERIPGGVPYNSILSRIYRGTYYVDFAPVFSLAPQDVEVIRSRYDAGIAYTDHLIGRLLDLLAELDLEGNTLVAVHSVHGEDLGEHGYYNHYDLYDTEVRNALAIRFPGAGYGGRKISAQVEGIDLMPTLLDYLGIPLNHEAMGSSALPLIREGGATGGREFSFSTRIPPWEIAMAIVHSLRGWGLFFRPDTDREKGEHEQYMNMLLDLVRNTRDELPHDVSVRSREWKLILRGDRQLLERISWWAFLTGNKVPVPEVELYDLVNDPGEQNNVASSHPAVVSELSSRLREWNSLVEKRRTRVMGSGSPPELIPYP